MPIMVGGHNMKCIPTSSGQITAVGRQQDTDQISVLALSYLTWWRLHTSLWYINTIWCELTRKNCSGLGQISSLMISAIGSELLSVSENHLKNDGISSRPRFLPFNSAASFEVRSWQVSINTKKNHSKPGMCIERKKCGRHFEFHVQGKHT